MDIVGQKDDVITRLQDLISHLEETVKDYVSCTYLNFLYKKKNQTYACHGFICFGKLIFCK